PPALHPFSLHAALPIYLIRREAFPACGFAPLTIENTCDHVIRIMNGQTTKQRDRIFVRVETMRLHARQGEIDFRESTTFHYPDEDRKSTRLNSSHVSIS